MAFEDAALVWSDPHHLVECDRWENGEERWHAIGLIGGTVVVIVVHTYPGDGDTVVRIISARKATNGERKAYETTAF